MNDLINSSNGLNLSMTNTTTIGSLASELLSAIPYALARPILDYQRTNKQADLIKAALEAWKQERADILATMRVLAQYNQLTPELNQMLMVAYGLPTFF